MKVALATLLLIHGAIHGLGFAKAFGLAELTMLRAPIGRTMGVLWLVAGLLLLSSAGTLFAAPRAWGPLTLAAVVLSQVVIATAWSDAKFGTIANAIVVIPLVVALAGLRSDSLGATYAREVTAALADPPPVSIVTEADLDGLPPLLQAHLRHVGVVGRPRVHSLRARFRGEIKAKLDGEWMAFTSDQVNTFDRPTRIFRMEARQFGVPFVALHRYVGEHATMQVRVAELFDVVDARGPQMNTSETVTMLNDMCMLAPAALLDADITWRQLDAHRLEASFTHAGNTVRAELTFDEGGDLIGFVSHDRYLSEDGEHFENLPWSTPFRDHRDFAGVRIAGHGDAVWLREDGPFEYGRFELVSLEYDVGP